MQKVFRNAIFDPNKKDLTHLNEVLDQTWENIETAILAIAKKMNRISPKCLLVEVKNNQIRCINYLTETKVNKISYGREELEGWLIEVYTWCKALEGKFTTKSKRAKSTEIKGFV
ncbi:40305_t:CDS:2 [Gigaspora margarita]|uniref:40305_t:CDS:1 n=1 Tax=Gigaspora margarita TaxID=4874 RepID=A0ABN7VEY3_GIGMA|nr:40305_t:CDS:2 [Gigaspora margarita]